MTLRYTKEFNEVYNKSTKVWHTPLFVIFYKKSSDKRVGFVASKKIGNAVARNRAKRILRAHFIKQCDELQLGSYIFVAKKPLLQESYINIRSIFEKAFIKIG